VLRSLNFISPPRLKSNRVNTRGRFCSNRDSNLTPALTPEFTPALTPFLLHFAPILPQSCSNFTPFYSSADPTLPQVSLTAFCSKFAPAFPPAFTPIDSSFYSNILRFFAKKTSVLVRFSLISDFHFLLTPAIDSILSPGVDPTFAPECGFFSSKIDRFKPVFRILLLHFRPLQDLPHDLLQDLLHFCSSFLRRFLNFANIILLLTKLASNVKMARFNEKIPRILGIFSSNLAILTLLASFVITEK
jgi:hypothetical protein